MRTRENHFYSRYGKVLRLIRQSKSLTRIPALAQHVADMEILYQQLSPAVEMLNSKRSRYLSCVKVAHNALSVYLYGPLTLLVNIYKRRSDVVTADSLTIYTSYYKRMGSASLLKLCDRVLELGYQNLDVLAVYNITSSTLEQLFTRRQALSKACESLLLYEQKRKEAAMTVAVLTQQAQ